VSSPEPTTQQCTDCGKLKPLDAFKRRQSGKLRRQCLNRKSRERQARKVS
jgi:recombinational DNA repair protein (RecF pathway)